MEADISPEGYLCHLLLVVRHKSFNIWLVKERDIMFQSTKCIAGKGCFCRTAPRSKYTSSQWGASNGCGEKPLSCYVTPPPTHSLATKMRHSIRYLLDGPQLRKENSGCVGVFGPAGTPARVVFSHRTQPGHSPPSHHSAAASRNQF